MKKQYLLFSFIILVFGTQLSAQTLKNIYRHNQPVLQIPTHLIDKVETVDVGGIKHLQITSLVGELTQIPISEIDSITHQLDSVNPDQLGNLRTASVMGIVRDTGNAPVNNAVVRSPFGGEETHTDANGVFFLNDIVVYDKLGYITITKPGFHQASRSFLPLETGSNRVNIQLIPLTLSGSFSAASGGTITSGLIQLNFPANAIQLNGQPYFGTVNVFAAALDPSSPEMFDQMPGELLGGMNDSLRLLRSFGMATIELRDANMNELQLTEGASATLTFNIPSALQTDAPETIDWWSFDETLGYWKHEGLAQKQGNQYIGAASHFSWWNCDVPQNFNDLHGTVNTVDGTPISDAQINVVTPSMGTGITYTNAEGVFSGRVPKNQLLTLNIYLTCETINDWNLVYTEDFSSAAEPIIGQFEPASLDGRYPITGTVVNCEGQPVESGYIRMGSQFFLTNEAGQFTIQTCAMGEYVIRGYDTSLADSIKASELVTAQVSLQGFDAGALQACLDIFGTLTDVEGNIYETVLIGNQWWMEENLRTATYANGDPIPNVTDTTQWSNLSTGAWAHYENNSQYETPYGKLYNWYTVDDPRNLCPTGWHVPTDSEWTVLTDYLGGQAVAGGQMKSPGTQYWSIPNQDATNESGFSGLPGGGRSTTGSFYSIGENGQWWSYTEANILSAWNRNLNYVNGLVGRAGHVKKVGSSVRCLRD